MKIINADLFRESIRQEFSKFIKGKDILINLEKGIFNSTIKEAKGKKIVRKWDNNNFVNLYLNKYRSVWANINKDSHVHNEYLINKINLGEISAYKIAFMNSREMYPEK